MLRLVHLVSLDCVYEFNDDVTTPIREILLFTDEVKVFTEAVWSLNNEILFFEYSEKREINFYTWMCDLEFLTQLSKGISQA